MKTNHAEKQAMREIFGDDWRQGIKRMPEIQSRRDCPPSIATEAKKNKQVQRDRDRKKMMLQGMSETYKIPKNKVTAKQMSQYSNILSETL